MRLNISDVTIELLERAQQLSHLPAVRTNSSNQSLIALLNLIGRLQEKHFICPYPSYPNISN